MRGKKNLVLSIVVLGLILTMGVSYSYFTSDNINNKESNFKISSKDLSIVLTDNMELNGNDITPGWSNSKSFTIKNNSNGTYNYNIVLKDLVNTFVIEGFLQYKITSSNGGYNTKGYINIPKSDTPRDIVIGYDIDIEKGITQEYQIEFIYRDSEEVDQSEDMGKIFKGTLAIEEGTVNPNIKYSVTLNVDNATVDENPKEIIKRGSVEFNVIPNEGYTLGTTVTCDNNANGVIENGKVRISNVTANTICELDNEINTYTIEMKVVNGKSNALNKIIPYNGSNAFTITPNTGYTLTGATLEGEGCTIENNIVSVLNVKKNGVCTLVLPKDKYQVILTGENVTVTDSPKQVEYEGSTTFNVTPSTGFTMSEAAVNCDGGASTSINGNTITISNVLKGQTCTITPKQIKYDVTLEVVNGTGNTTKSINHGGSDTFNISANSTYTLESPTISCDGSAITSYTNGELTVSNVTGSQTCTVTLKHTSYLVTVTSNNNNYGTVSPTSQSIVHGNNATITLSPKTGYKYSSNTCGGTVSGNTMTINNIISAKTCTITFEIIRANNENLYTYLTNGKVYIIDSNRNITPTSPIEGTSITQGYKVVSNGETKTGGVIFNKTEDNINHYYFAGNPSDNWVEFAGFNWRIIRTNEVEGTRLLYAGVRTTIGPYYGTDTMTGYINNTKYQWYASGYENNRLVEWKYTSSTIGSALTNWYNSYITGTNAKLVNTNIEYCNDLSSSGVSPQYYGLYNRKLNSGAPIYSCKLNNGNSSHKSIGLITADEVALAGAAGSYSPNTYFYRNSLSSGCTRYSGDPCSVVGDSYSWTMSPYSYNGRTNIYVIYGSGNQPGFLGSVQWDTFSVIRPVITLLPSVEVSGSGTTSDPFVPITN